MQALAVIPARLASTRLPGKVLADVGGRPLIQWVHARVAQAARVGRVVVATDADEVAAVCAGFGAEVFRSGTPHACGTDRVAEVARALGVPADAPVLNVQADEPTLDPALLDALVALLAEAPLASPMTPIQRVADFLDPSVVKVVCDGRGDALYFSRAPIPWPRDAALQPAGAWPAGLVAWKHVGVYGYRGAALQRWAAAPRSALEITESLEQLRALAAGDRLRMLPWAGESLGVDTPGDLARLRAQVSEKSQ